MQTRNILSLHLDSSNFNQNEDFNDLSLLSRIKKRELKKVFAENVGKTWVHAKVRVSERGKEHDGI